MCVCGGGGTSTVHQVTKDPYEVVCCSDTKDVTSNCILMAMRLIFILPFCSFKSKVEVTEITAICTTRKSK